MRITECVPNLGGFIIFFRELKLSLEIASKWNAARNDLNLSVTAVVEAHNKQTCKYPWEERKAINRRNSACLTLEMFDPFWEYSIQILSWLTVNHLGRKPPWGIVYIWLACEHVYGTALIKLIAMGRPSPLWAAPFPKKWDLNISKWACVFSTADVDVTNQPHVSPFTFLKWWTLISNCELKQTPPSPMLISVRIFYHSNRT